MKVAYVVLIILGTCSAFVSAMAAGMQLAGIRGAQFPFPFVLGPSWAWFWADVVLFTGQIAFVVYASYKTASV